MKVWRILILVLLGLSGIALALQYKVNLEGGPLTLEEDVKAAFARWEAVPGADVTATASDKATTAIGYGDATRFGPDTLSLTVTETENQARTLRILLNPDVKDKRVLLFETGILLGLQPEPDGRGVMNPAIGPKSPSAPTKTDQEALRALKTYAPADLNHDGVVNFYDLIALAQAFGKTGVNLRADLNHDGRVDKADLELLKKAYVFSDPSRVPPASLQSGGAASTNIPNSASSGFSGGSGGSEPGGIPVASGGATVSGGSASGGSSGGGGAAQSGGASGGI